MSLSMCVTAALAVQLQTPATPATTETQPPTGLQPARRKRYVFAFLPALTFGINAWAIPSISGSFFFGGRLRREQWALGLQATLSSGLADRYYIGLLAFRFHFTALHHFKSRGFATIGGGIASFLWYPAVVEAETKLGVRLGRRKRVVVGGLLRLGINFFYREQAPLPQFGIFTGMSFL